MMGIKNSMTRKFFRVGDVSFFLRSHKVDISQQGGLAGVSFFAHTRRNMQFLSKCGF